MSLKMFGYLSLLLFYLTEIQAVNLNNENLTLTLDSLNPGISINLSLNGNSKILGQIGETFTNIEIIEDCEGKSNCLLQGEDFTLNISSTDGGFILTWQTANLESNFQDCIDLDIGKTFWYGGAEVFAENWPMENLVFKSSPYRVTQFDNGAVVERYWLNSQGAYIFVDDKVPLFLDQNNIKNGSICFLAKTEDPYLGRERNLLEYVLVAKENAREAHLHAVNNYLGKPMSHPDEWIVRNPIWTTWAKYKKDISDDVVLEFANDIADHGFTGQIEIDDNWETCYGELVFNEKFENINSTVRSLKDLGFTVTLWTHPFVNHNCDEVMNYGREHDYFVKSEDGDDVTSWWDGDPSHHIDYTNEEASDWFIERLRSLQERHGIDGFKFDAGESDRTPPNPVFKGDVELTPNSLTSSFVRTCANFGGLIEVRTAWRTQDVPILLRMNDRDSSWTYENNGLPTIVSTLLQFNIIGYTMVLPDMIGGNGYTELPNAELLARWTQVNTFMPTMQFSYLPWDITSQEFDGLEIIKKNVALHAEYADEILKAMDASITVGTPVNPPIWWLDPFNEDALKSNDEFLLGENILVAPVIVEGAISRDIVLPSGTWRDGNNGELYEGPQILENYPAPIDVLPFFIRQ